MLDDAMPHPLTDAETVEMDLDELAFDEPHVGDGMPETALMESAATLQIPTALFDEEATCESTIRGVRSLVPRAGDGYTTVKLISAATALLATDALD